jgi:hypothetical protein
MAMDGVDPPRGRHLAIDRASMKGSRTPLGQLRELASFHFSVSGSSAFPLELSIGTGLHQEDEARTTATGPRNSSFLIVWNCSFSHGPQSGHRCDQRIRHKN